jgi:hypothetical protein
MQVVTIQIPKCDMTNLHSGCFSNQFHQSNLALLLGNRCISCTVSILDVVRPPERSEQHTVPPLCVKTGVINSHKA